MTALGHLPVELLRYIIADFCDTPSCCALSATCQWLHSICTEELYRSIDLSRHNSSETANFFEYGPHPIPAYNVMYPETPLDQAIRKRQRSLLATLQTRPGYGEHVRHLAWSIIMAPPGRKNGNYQLYENSIDYRITIRRDDPIDLLVEDSPLWAAFSTMTKVIIIDVFFLRMYRESCPPPPLFPSATSIRLGGQVSRSFVRAILGERDASALRHLDFDGLSQYANPLPDPPDGLTHAQLMQYCLDLYPIRESIERSAEYAGERKNTPAGPLSGHMQPYLTRRCTNLTSLRIGTWAPQRSEDLRPHDAARYREYGAFLGSIRPTLRSLFFEQNGDNWVNEQLALQAPEDSLRPGEQLFTRFIHPVLLEAEWPCLERLEVRGVGVRVKLWPGQYTQEPPSLPKSTESIRYKLRSLPGREQGWRVEETDLRIGRDFGREYRPLMKPEAEILFEAPLKEYEVLEGSGIWKFITELNAGRVY
ncbi:uncharacterized protein K452DRAFT_302263 [Aplosporella prunicola CBS 121167]|uniref:F-box domain-containing protein n=1 Tax=Aplosporella prunicola CBS 121167 TaxID=1176127 RepID=A0A6A6B306_9PEZI|nr:uncharacterized protein K452DRAFT_302263 [Aplosporella prunicola CBS 121167]KAF2137111.1 hypothetical protein K452DRAFT_302263 [Aplosporella prunicola CBS 121167]